MSTVVLPDLAVPLAPLTTLRLGGPARGWSKRNRRTSWSTAVRDADEPVLVMGGGSNLVIADAGWPGVVVRIASRGRRVERRPDGSVLLTVEAGEDWDDVVAATVADGLGGLECLSGIPGRTGAVPVQNVGAYGVEIADALVDVDLWTGGAVRRVPAADLGLAYRTSALRAGPTPSCCACGSRCRATAAAPRSATPSSPGRSASCRVTGCPRPSPARPCSRCGAARAWCSTRPTTTRGAQARSSPTPCWRRHRRSAPTWPAGPGRVKVSAAWLIERSGFRRGHAGPGGRVALSSRHVLALTHRGGGTTADLLALAAEVRDGVHARFGVVSDAGAGAGRMLPVTG